MKITITIITIIIVLGSGIYFHYRTEHMRNTCESVAGEFYTISFDEGTCIIGNDVIHLHYQG